MEGWAPERSGGAKHAPNLRDTGLRGVQRVLGMLIGWLAATLFAVAVAANVPALLAAFVTPRRPPSARRPVDRIGTMAASFAPLRALR